MNTFLDGIKQIFSFFKLKLKDKIALSFSFTLLIIVGFFRKELKLENFYSIAMPWLLIFDALSISSVAADIISQRQNEKKIAKQKREEELLYASQLETQRRKAHVKRIRFENSILELEEKEKSKVQQMYNDEHHRMYLSDYDSETLDLIKKGIIIKTGQYTREDEFIGTSVNKHELKHLYVLSSEAFSVIRENKDKFYSAD